MNRWMVAGLLFFGSGAATSAADCSTLADSEGRYYCEQAEAAHLDGSTSDGDPASDGAARRWCKYLEKQQPTVQRQAQTWLDCYRTEKILHERAKSIYYQQLREADMAQRQARDDEKRSAAVDAWVRRQESAEAEKRQALVDADVARKQAAADARQAAQAKAAADALRAECGDDYKSVRVGMTVARAQRCVAPFKLKGQINRIDGVLVDSYRYCVNSRCTYLSVIDGVVAAWQRD